MMSKAAHARYYSLSQAVADITTMHGSVIGDPEEEHHTDAAKCECERGHAIRTIMRSMKGAEQLRKKRGTA